MYGRKAAIAATAIDGNCEVGFITGTVRWVSL